MTFVFLVAAAALLGCSSACVAAAREAAETFAFSVLPALFPLMVLSALWGGARHGEPSCRGGRWAIRLIGLPACALPALLLGLLGGSPTGAKLCRGLSNALSPAQRKRLLAYTGTMSPMFFAGALALWLQSPDAGFRLLGCHWLAALLCGELSRLWFRPARGEGCETPVASGLRCANVHTMADVPSPGVRLREALAQTADSLLVVCGAMMLCAVAFALLSAALAPLWPGFAGSRVAAAVHAALEIGAGGRALAQPGLPAVWQAALCGLCGFGGVSLLLQNLSFAGGHIRARELLGLRLLQGALSAGLFWLLTAFNGKAAPVFGAATALRAAVTAPQAWLPVGCLFLVRLLRFAPRHSSPSSPRA